MRLRLDIGYDTGKTLLRVGVRVRLRYRQRLPRERSARNGRLRQGRHAECGKRDQKNGSEPGDVHAWGTLTMIVGDRRDSRIRALTRWKCAMAVQFRPISDVGGGNFGAEAIGVHPALRVAGDTFHTTEAAWYRPSIQLFRGLALNGENPNALPPRPGPLD